jgi:hypothetical protein
LIAPIKSFVVNFALTVALISSPPDPVPNLLGMPRIATMRYTSPCMSMPSDPFNESGGKLAPAASGRERRRDPRYPLTAEARVTEIESHSEIKARISDISISGCYLDFSNPLPNGTDIVLKISRDNGVFETNAKVVFVLPHMGMGIRFTETKPTQQAILARWIAELAILEESGN